MKRSNTLRYFNALSLTLLVAVTAFGSTVRANGKRIEFTTASKEAKEQVAQIVYRIETFQFGPQVFAIAKKAVEADPEFAFGYYLLGTMSPTPAEAKPHIDKAVELAKKASEGERRYIEAVLLARAQKFDESLAIFTDLARQFPGERMVQMMLGQVYMGMGKLDEAKAAFERAIQLDGGTPRVYTLLGNIALLKGDYAKARELFNVSWSKRAANTAPFGPGYGLVYAHLYQGDLKSALKALENYEAEYAKNGDTQNGPAVFIWNSIARLHLENGQPEEAIKAYEKGYATVPASNLSEMEKKTWLGRLHHGKGRALAKMGKYEEAWNEAELIKKMIEENGEAGKQFWPSYHYLAGYVKLESGDYAAAIEHLKQADQTDPFIKLLLARAYEKSGDKTAAQSACKEVVKSNQVTLDRALAYPEAKRKLKA
ncbi:MAG TPA: tetratricopeptide repeat protein [Blastocatellia bacterium]|nr:tetratricopeptide repeat protein [Blastocatellia bacterium]